MDTGTDLTKNPSLYMRDLAISKPDEVAIFEEDASNYRKITYSEAENRINAVARVLVETGVGLGHTVAVLSYGCM